MSNKLYFVCVVEGNSGEKGKNIKHRCQFVAISYPSDMTGVECVAEAIPLKKVKSRQKVKVLIHILTMRHHSLHLKSRLDA